MRNTPDLVADYEKAGFSGALGFGTSPALVIVDMCNAYLEPSSPLYAGVEEECSQIERLLQTAREQGLPVIHTRVEYNETGSDGGLFYKKVKALKCFTKGNPLGECPAALTPLPNEINITKQYASAFFGTSLASSLNAMGCDSVFICGVSTSGCVRATALDALQHGFIPLVIEDACGDRDEAVHKANLFDLQAKYADLTTTETVVDRMKAHHIKTD